MALDNNRYNNPNRNNNRMNRGPGRGRRPNRYHKILRRMQSRLWFIFAVVCVLFVVLIVRLMFIEYSSGDRYEKIVLSQQGYSNEVIPFQRGDIVDRKGSVLATSVDVYNVILDCKVLNETPEKIDSTIDAITSVIPEISDVQIRDALKDRKDSQYEVLLKKVDNERMEAFERLKEDNANKDKIAGIWFEKEYMRTYPYDSLAAAMIGYCSDGNVGALGIESEYNNVLNGTNGRKYGLSYYES